MVSVGLSDFEYNSLITTHRPRVVLANWSSSSFQRISFSVLLAKRSFADFATDCCSPSLFSCVLELPLLRACSRLASWDDRASRATRTIGVNPVYSRQSIGYLHIILIGYSVGCGKYTIMCVQMKVVFPLESLKQLYLHGMQEMDSFYRLS